MRKSARSVNSDPRLSACRAVTHAYLESPSGGGVMPGGGEGDDGEKWSLVPPSLPLPLPLGLSSLHEVPNARSPCHICIEVRDVDVVVTHGGVEVDVSVDVRLV